MNDRMTDKELTDANFALEQDILKCWNIVDDVKDILADLRHGALSAEDATQALEAYAAVYQNRFDRTWRRYETVCQGLHELRHSVKGFELAQTASPKSGKMSKSKKQKPVDNQFGIC
jgi:hypothetical protein